MKYFTKVQPMLKNIRLADIFAVILIAGGFLFSIIFLSRLGFWGFVTSFFPSSAILLVFFYFIIAGTYYFLKNKEAVTYSLLNWALYLMVFQFSIFEIVFKVYFGPYLGFGFTDSPYLKFNADIKWFSFRFSIGLNKGDDSFSFFINFIPILLLYFLDKELTSLKRVKRLESDKMDLPH